MTTEKTLRTCVRCVMDESAPNIVVDAHGVCNFCRDFEAKLSELQRLQGQPQALARLVETVQAAGRGKAYDCVVGLSGGVDSSYVLHLVKEQGLRPLAVHLDNGWNSELAVANIHALVDKLGVDLYTHVIDWDENRDMQLSMFKAGVIDIELLMDNAMLALNYQCAARYKLRHIISGSNRATSANQIGSSASSPIRCWERSTTCATSTGTSSSGCPGWTTSTTTSRPQWPC